MLSVVVRVTVSHTNVNQLEEENQYVEHCMHGCHIMESFLPEKKHQ